MLTIRKKEDIFHIQQSWFEGYWHFSFGGPEGFHDAENTSFGALRVFNVDTLVPGGVWPMHSHRDIEVITYCFDGEFQHADNTGKEGVLQVGDVQHTTVGSGMLHEEINHRPDVPMTFLQIWVTPRELGLKPALENRSVDRSERRNRFLTLVSDRDPGALPIAQDAEFIVASVEQGTTVTHPLADGYGAYFYVASDRVSLLGEQMSAGDAVKVTDEPEVAVEALTESELAMVVVRV